MLEFIIGLIVGSIVGFGTCAFLCVANEGDQTDNPPWKERGDKND